MTSTKSAQKYATTHITITCDERRRQVVRFKPGRNLNSDKYDDSKIHLLGEIEAVCHY